MVDNKYDMCCDREGSVADMRIQLDLAIWATKLWVVGLLTLGLKTQGGSPGGTRHHRKACIEAKLSLGGSVAV